MVTLQALINDSFSGEAEKLNVQALQVCNWLSRPSISYSRTTKLSGGMEFYWILKQLLTPPSYQHPSTSDNTNKTKWLGVWERDVACFVVGELNSTWWFSNCSVNGLMLIPYKTMSHWRRRHMTTWSSLHLPWPAEELTVSNQALQPFLYCISETQ